PAFTFVLIFIAVFPFFENMWLIAASIAAHLHRRKSDRNLPVAKIIFLICLDWRGAGHGLLAIAQLPKCVSSASGYCWRNLQTKNLCFHSTEYRELTQLRPNLPTVYSLPKTHNIRNRSCR